MDSENGTGLALAPAEVEHFEVSEEWRQKIGTTLGQKLQIEAEANLVNQRLEAAKMLIEIVSNQALDAAGYRMSEARIIEGLATSGQSTFFVVPNAVEKE